ncbi:MAG: class I tRNA ligase family protein, partial [Alphaproteobacteria bacterium]|nr:class I tRNA ligase family protein [Alphaproteobacteria bacterium]
YNDAKLHNIIAGGFVSDDSGTGIVHIAPAFGEDDFWALKDNDPEFPVIVNVDNYGNFDATVRDFSGENIFAANPKIIANLKERGHLVKKEQYKHAYPYGDRSKEKLIYRATESWYINVPKIKDKLLINNELVTWTSAGERFRAWIENARPWSISRNRFWGVPLPIWARGDEYKIFGSIAELQEFFGVEIHDLHRPTMDALTKDGWTRIPDVLDCWVESGSMPWASLHYPFDPSSHSDFDAELPKNFPADYIIEGQDQTRGWFYSLMVLATALFDKPAFITVSANGMVVDEHKKKFSKSVGNYVNPEQQIEQFGADAIRLFILGSNFMKAEPVPMDKEGKVFGEPTKNILVPLWNAYHFFTLYANAGAVTAQETVDSRQSENVLDKYILAELNDLTGVVRGALDEYKPDAALRGMTSFLEILNNWYIRRSRERFWNEEQSAFDTLHFVLVKFTKLLAPFAPFVSDHIFRNLTDPENKKMDTSVHLEKFPENESHAFDSKESFILDTMRYIQQIVSVGKQLREKHALRNRLPLNNISIYGTSINLGDYALDIIKGELNVKNAENKTTGLENVADSFVYLITPKIGARLGAGLKEIMTASKQPGFDPVAHGLLPDEYEMRLTVKPGITGAALPDNTAVVVLDTNVTPELLATGLANDALRFIQDTRKAMDLDVSDRITLTVSGDMELLTALDTHKVRIMADALITDMHRGTADEFHTEIEGHKFGIKITKV